MVDQHNSSSNNSSSSTPGVTFAAGKRQKKKDEDEEGEQQLSSSQQSVIMGTSRISIGSSSDDEDGNCNNGVDQQLAAISDLCVIDNGDRSDTNVIDNSAKDVVSAAVSEGNITIIKTTKKVVAIDVQKSRTRYDPSSAPSAVHNEELVEVSRSPMATSGARNDDNSEHFFDQSYLDLPPEERIKVIIISKCHNKLGSSSFDDMYWLGPGSWHQWPKGKFHEIVSPTGENDDAVPIDAPATLKVTFVPEQKSFLIDGSNNDVPVLLKKNQSTIVKSGDKLRIGRSFYNLSIVNNLLPRRIEGASKKDIDQLNMWELRKHLGIRGMNIEGRKAALASRVLAVARVENQNQNHEGEEEEVVEEEEGSTEHRPEWTEVEGEDWVDTNEEDYQDSVDEVDYSDEEDEEWEEGTEWVWK